MATPFLSLAVALLALGYTVVAHRECQHYKVLNTADRASTRSQGNVLKCDQKEILTKAWYRFEGAAGSAMPTSLVPINRCGTHAPGWMEGSHPTVAEGIVTRKVCYHWSGKTCHWNNAIRVRNCGGFYVYELNRPPVCHLRYCGNAEFETCSSKPCKNGGTCREVNGAYSCTCKSGFTGKNCEQDVNECSENPCKNGGVCKNEHGGYSCACKAGFMGKNCEQDVNECSKNPCQNGGVCKNEHGGYSCTCKAGFTGKICEQDVNECSKNPCKNGGVCKNEHGGYSCVCKAGFTGKNCEQDVDECAGVNPCHHGGVCSNSHGGYSCKCASGYTGKNCEQDKNECKVNPCLNNGKCINTPGSYKCNCIDEYTGKHCETEPQEPGAPKYKELGCYKDNGNDKNKPRRTIPEMIANFRPQIDWHDMSKTVNECAKHAKEKGYEIFGVQFYGECYSGPTAEIDYERDGKAERGKCWAGVGGPSTNMVYRIE